MRRAFLSHGVATCLAGLLAAGHPAAGATRAPAKSPRVEIVGEGRVVTAPRRTVHENGRAFLEFQVTLISARPASDQPPGAQVGLAIDTSGRVRVVHDLSCGGDPLALSVGDTVEIRGEYVRVSPGRDLIHFTHAAGGKCGHDSRQPAGYLRLAPRAAPLRPAVPPLAEAVPDQPFRGPAPEVVKPYAAILAEKQAGASEEALLSKIRHENVRYSLTTSDIQKLRADGVSETVIEAMLRSGRVATTPTPR